MKKKLEKLTYRLCIKSLSRAKKYPSRTIAFLVFMAKRNSAEACVQISLMYYKGIHFPVDYRESYKWAHKAYDAGWSRAFWLMSLILMKISSNDHTSFLSLKDSLIPETVQGRRDLARKWAEMGADLNDRSALAILARIIIAENAWKDDRYFHKIYEAAVNGDHQSRIFLAIECFKKNKKASLDGLNCEDSGKEWLRQPLAEGSSSAHFAMATLLKDKVLSRESGSFDSHIQMAIKLNHKNARTLLGVHQLESGCKASGLETLKDDARKNSSSAAALGDWYLLHSEKKSESLAIQWYNIAAQMGHAGARKFLLTRQRQDWSCHVN